MSPHTNPFGPDGWTPERLGSLRGKTYLITGANSGAGFAASRELLAKGATVVMLNRSPEKSSAAIAALKGELGSGADVTFIRTDLASLDSVREAAGEVLTRVPRIDALICNGAIAQVPTQRLTVDGFESQLGVNHLGHFLLAGLLYERIEASRGRVVVVGSLGYKAGLKRIKFEDLNFDEGYSAWDSYAQSKLAQMMFAYELQRRVEAAGTGVQVHVCHPGSSRTSLITNSGGLRDRILFRLMTPLTQSAQKGSWPEVLCATEDGLRSETLYGPTQRGEWGGRIGGRPIDDFVLDRDAAAKLWAVSEAKTGITWPIPAGTTSGRTSVTDRA